MSEIAIDNTRNENLTTQGDLLIREYYMLEHELSPQEAFARAASAYNSDPELKQRIYDYVSKGWFMFASPVLSNAPEQGKKAKGMPISCFLSYVGDSLEELIDHTVENRWLSVKGGGVGGHWSDIRAVSDIAPGPLPFLATINIDTVAYRQGKTRKGSYAAYMDVSHPDIVEFIGIRVPTGGDVNTKCLNLNNAVNVTDDFMEAVVAGTSWDLKCPNTGEVSETIDARELWTRILTIRHRTGEPYLNFIDESNRHLPAEMKAKGLKINGSNLCNEIHLPTSSERTAVCCLSSVNLEKYDEWKDTDMVGDLIEFLDDVLQFFIDNAPAELSRAKYSAEMERSLGLGAMGFHAFLQNKNIPWESAMAQVWNKKIFKDIKNQAQIRTALLGIQRGCCPDVAGVRNSHLLAVAPNANSGMMLNTSFSIEPILSNSFIHKSRVGSHVIRNTRLKAILAEKGQDLEEVWQSIDENEGSVQHLGCLDDIEKAVFKTAVEIDQSWVVQHAADRQVFICQGQSVNLFFPSKTNRAYMNRVHLEAWNKKLKGLYYLRTEAAYKPDNINKSVERSALSDFNECIACEG